MEQLPFLYIIQLLKKIINIKKDYKKAQFLSSFF